MALQFSTLQDHDNEAAKYFHESLPRLDHSHRCINHINPIRSSTEDKDWKVQFLEIPTYRLEIRECKASNSLDRLLAILDFLSFLIFLFWKICKRESSITSCKWETRDNQINFTDINNFIGPLSIYQRYFLRRPFDQPLENLCPPERQQRYMSIGETQHSQFPLAMIWRK